MIEEYKIKEFFGLDTETKNLREIKPGFSPDAKNWLTRTNLKGIELRRGMELLGDYTAGEGKITGLSVGKRFDGKEIPFFTHGRKIRYYNEDDNKNKEIGTDTLPVLAQADEVSMFPYQNLAGSWVYLSSKNSSIYKIAVANPANVVDQTSLTYRGFYKFGQSRAFLYDRHGNEPGNKDSTSLYVSKVDKVDLSQYPAQTTGEVVGTGDGTEKTFAHTLAVITGKRTAMFVEITDSVETFRDDRNGGLVGDQGGTGTINYSTGAVSITFNTAPINLQSITAKYYYEDATSGGVADFSIADVSDRLSGEGNVFPQFDGGGNLNAVYPLATVFYCFHEIKTWQVAIPVDDESGTDSISTNLPFRESMGVKSHYGAYGGERGIYFINTATGKPEMLRLQLYQGATESNIASPELISKLIDFTNYDFEKAQIIESQDFVLVACAKITNEEPEDTNTITFIYNKKSGAWDILDYAVSRFAIYNGKIIAGDPVSNNVFTLLSGYDDYGADEGIIQNYYTTGQMDFGMPGQKRFTRIAIEGLIQKDQQVKVSLSYDGGAFVESATIDGLGEYVDTTQDVLVGSHTIGEKGIGGEAEIIANPFRVEFRIQSPTHQDVRLKLEAVRGGYVAIESIAFRDIREKSIKTMPTRVQT